VIKVAVPSTPTSKYEHTDHRKLDKSADRQEIQKRVHILFRGRCLSVALVTCKKEKKRV
jgi:hypothetical protein